MLDPYVLFTFKGIQQRGALPAQERGSQKLPRVLDPYVLLTFEGIQQRGALPGQEREAPRSCCGCWILTSSLLLQELSREEPCQARGERLPEAAAGCWILPSFFFKEFSREEPCQARRERLPEAGAGAGSLRPPYF